MPIEVGQIVEGKVTGITKFGAFVTLETGESGLVHISEVSKSFVEDINDFLKKDDTVTVKVMEIKGDKINLSIRKAQEPPKVSRPPKERDNRAPRKTPVEENLSFEDRLSRFMKESNERHDQIRHRANKRAMGNRTKKNVHA